MLSLWLGYSLIGASFAGLSYPAFESVFLKKRYNERKMKENLHKAFVNAGLYKRHGDEKEYPRLISYDDERGRLTFVIYVPKGLSPDKFKEALYVFKQHFGKHIELDVDVKRVTLKVYKKGLPTEYKYNYKNLSEKIKGMRVPVIAGVNMFGELVAYDMVGENRANLIIIGEPGAGKSTQLRQIITTWVKHIDSDRLKMYLADLKRSEFYLFRSLKNTEVATTEEEFIPLLSEIKKEMNKRGSLLDEHEVSHIDDLPIKLPYIALCIDEFSILAQNQDILKSMQQITSLGRALGIVCLISMQRASHDLIPTFIRSNMNVGMGFRVVDSSNAKMIGTEGAEQLTTPGRMIFNLNGLSEIQAPFLDVSPAKKLLKPLKVEKQAKIQEPQQDDLEKLKELLSDE